MRQALHEGQDDQLAAIGFQRGKAAAQRRALAAARQDRQRVGAVVCLFRNSTGQDVPPATADDVERAIAGEADQPGLAVATLGIKPARLLPDLEEGVMRGVRRQRGLAGDAQRDAVQPRGETFVELAQRRLVPVRAAAEEMGRVVVLRRGGVGQGGPPSSKGVWLRASMIRAGRANGCGRRRYGPRRRRGAPRALGS